MKSSRSLAASLALFIAGGLCAAAIMEAGLKLIASTPLWHVLPVIEPILGRPDRDAGYVFTPGASGIWTTENRARVIITDLGLRGPAGIATAKTEGAQRIAMFGDSMTEALQVEYPDTFSALLQENLRNAANGSAQVVNLAMSGNSPLRQLVRLERLGYSLHPDLVVMVMSPRDFMTGELRDDSSYPGYVRDGKGSWARGYAFRDRFAIRYADSVAGQLFLGAVQESDVLRMLYLRSRDPMPKLFGIQSAARPVAATDLADDLCYKAELEQLQGFWIGHEPSADWEVAMKLLEELQAGAADRQVRFAFALRDLPVPAPNCVDQHVNRTALVNAIRQLLSARNIALIDLESRLIVRLNAGSSMELRTLHGFGQARGSGHLNYEGHRSYADVLADALRPLLPQ